jgi:hypothetical protein
MSRFIISNAKSAKDDPKSLKDSSLNKVDTKVTDKPLKLFSMYRRGDISEDHDENQRTDPDKPQFDGVIFRSGKAVISWNTEAKSVAVFDSFDELMKIHGHDKPGIDDRYQSEIKYYNISE